MINLNLKPIFGKANTVKELFSTLLACSPNDLLTCHNNDKTNVLPTHSLQTLKKEKSKGSITQTLQQLPVNKISMNSAASSIIFLTPIHLQYNYSLCVLCKTSCHFRLRISLKTKNPHYLHNEGFS